MNNKSRTIDPLPEEFASYEEAAEFWDNHDTTDYLDNFETVPLEAATLQHRHFEVSIDEDLIRILYQQAQQQGVGVGQLVNNMLRATLGHAA
jgi:predicted HicB family RNase H-like nuclease